LKKGPGTGKAEVLDRGLSKRSSIGAKAKGGVPKKG